MVPDRRTAGRESGSRRFFLEWPLWLVAAWFVYELTTQPALGATVACVKLGWPDIQTAWWLRRIDPKRTRARTCFWCYAAWGVFKIAWISYFAIFAALLCHAYVAERGRFHEWLADPLPKIAAGLVTLCVGTILALCAGVVAVWTAWRNKQKVWLDPAVTKARKLNRWPPRFTKSETSTLFGLVGAGLLVVGLLIPALAIPLVAFHTYDINPGPLGNVLLAVLVGVLGIVAFAAGESAWSAVRRAAVASTPSECWDGAEPFNLPALCRKGSAEELMGEEGPPDFPRGE